MLRTNPYVVVITVDFSKAYDTDARTTHCQKSLSPLVSINQCHHQSRSIIVTISLDPSLSPSVSIHRCHHQSRSIIVTISLDPSLSPSVSIHWCHHLVTSLDPLVSPSLSPSVSIHRCHHHCHHRSRSIGVTLLALQMFFGAYCHVPTYSREDFCFISYGRPEQTFKINYQYSSPCRLRYFSMDSLAIKLKWTLYIGQYLHCFLI